MKFLRQNCNLCCFVSFQYKGVCSMQQGRKASSFNVCMMRVLAVGCGRCSLQQRKDILHAGFFRKHKSSP